MFAGKKSAQIREILISESAWEEMTCLFAPSLTKPAQLPEQPKKKYAEISGSEPTCPACDPAIGHFPEASPDDERS